MIPVEKMPMPVAEKRACVWLHRRDREQVVSGTLVDQGLHGVDDDSGDGDVEPDREGVAGDVVCGQGSGQ